MAWLVRDGEVLATLEVAESRHDRRKGLLGRDGIDGALLLRPARSVHTIGMRFPIDVVYVDEGFVVLELVTMSRMRIGVPRMKAKAVIEAEAGTFAHWNLAPGDQLEITG